MTPNPERFIPSDSRRVVYVASPTKTQQQRSSTGKQRNHWAKRGLQKVRGL